MCNECDRPCLDPEGRLQSRDVSTHVHDEPVPNGVNHTKLTRRGDIIAEVMARQKASEAPEVCNNDFLS